MKLIDADELLSIVRHMTVVDKSVMHRILIQMPPVDAVPVSWVMAQVAERKERGTAFDLSVASTLRTMVKEWKDETD